ncbi:MULTISPECIES: HEAT repeat domain-containing protein [Legionella]|uniref:HEAT repeat domain-containing protein n=1 Tax=Legionella TaxID=445 RepID=UPI000F8E4A24|nr:MULTISPECIES: HEAT repeat domain-containing protein [Legionella]MCP0914686.1 HEAT repeat domain-containing protein [Legionella sp. 27cVA30]RUQ95756.1 HEAT repeat domain-containing protein [Legionella septentrionalis]RUR09130.1 HEAT repeat domain-containing protein [Legionella septentrionalis]
MNKIALWLLTSCFSSFTCSAQIVVDIYGANKLHAEQILREYTAQVIEIESELAKQREYFNLTGHEDIQKVEETRAKKARLMERIKKKGMFLYADVHTTVYPGEKNLYTTIEVIERTKPERLAFVNKDEQGASHLIQPDLIGKMQKYEALGWRLSDTGQLTEKDNICPVYHCIFGFNHPKLKPYLNIFNAGVIKEKTKILNALSNDPDPERRASAALLVGHFQNPKEIIFVLSKHVHDKSQLVRNNVIRVMGETIEKAPIAQINVEPFVSLLNSPYGTDRNKALFLLTTAPLDKKSKWLIIRKGQKSLLALLRLKQPNNRGWAYLLLKKISGKKYDEYDFSAWEKWLSTIKRV